MSFWLITPRYCGAACCGVVCGAPRGACSVWVAARMFLSLSHFLRCRARVPGVWYADVIR